MGTGTAIYQRLTAHVRQKKKKLNFKKTLKIANLNSQIKKLYLIHIFIKKTTKFLTTPLARCRFIVHAMLF